MVTSLIIHYSRKDSSNHLSLPSQSSWIMTSIQWTLSFSLFQLNFRCVPERFYSYIHLTCMPWWDLSNLSQSSHFLKHGTNRIGELGGGPNLLPMGIQCLQSLSTWGRVEPVVIMEGQGEPLWKFPWRKRAKATLGKKSTHRSWVESHWHLHLHSVLNKTNLKSSPSFLLPCSSLPAPWVLSSNHVASFSPPKVNQLLIPV